jgi:hypothetical protein
MALTKYPDRYLRFNDQQTKRLNVVIKIEGVPDLLTMSALYTRVRYGDPVKYGDTGLVYGGLRLKDNFRDYISLESSLSISQKIEPEQGKSSISTLSVVIIDRDEWASALISPGKIVDEIFGKQVRVYLGHGETSFPEDYFTYFRGYISSIKSMPGKVMLGFSDSNIRRKTEVFLPFTSKLSTAITASTTVITTDKTDGVYIPILGPDGLPDSSVRTFLKIENEWSEYGVGNVTSNSITAQRGGSHSRGTPVVAHDASSDMVHGLELQGNAIDLALKIMLSGWNGPWVSGIPVASIVQTKDPVIGDIPNSITLPSTLDAKDDHGLSIGDYCTISGSTAGNNLTCVVIDLIDLSDDKTRTIVLDKTLMAESNPVGVKVSFRSQFDTLPKSAGLKLTPAEVDVSGHVSLRRRFFSTGDAVMRFFLLDSTTGKEFIEQELFRPIGAYSVTRYGLLSVNTTLPPIAGEKLTILDKDNIIDPQNISVNRALNNRRFYNLIEYSYNKADTGEFQKVLNLFDSDSNHLIGLTSVLKIQSSGIRSDLGGDILVKRQGQHVLSRFKTPAYEIPLKVNIRGGSLIEIGDIVGLADNGDLSITNFDTGKRDLGFQLFEVMERKPDIKNGTVDVTLLSNVAFGINDRYATISPSSLVDTGSTTTSVRIKDSFGSVYGRGKEHLKWKDAIGLTILIHSYDWSRQGTATLTGIDPSNNYRLILAVGMGFAPQPDDIIDIAFYPEGTNLRTDQFYKVVYAHLDPTISVVSGASPSIFDVSAPDALKFTPGLPILIHNASYSVLSTESIVETVSGTTITLKTPLAFTPSAGQLIELVGFKDNGGPYRWV